MELSQFTFSELATISVLIRQSKTPGVTKQGQQLHFENMKSIQAKIIEHQESELSSAKD